MILGVFSNLNYDFMSPPRTAMIAEFQLLEMFMNSSFIWQYNNIQQSTTLIEAAIPVTFEVGTLPM